MGILTSVFALAMYAHDPDSIDLENQLSHMWLSGGDEPGQAPRMATENNFVVNVMNIIGERVLQSNETREQMNPLNRRFAPCRQPLPSSS